MMSPIGDGFRTIFDRPPGVLVPPAVVKTGHSPGFQVADQVFRATRLTGRFASSGLVGLKVRVEGEGVRVRVRVSVDAKSVRQWEKRIGSPQDAGRLPRLLLIRSQGRLRQSVLLDPRFGGRPYAWAVFDLMPGEVPEDGLLLIEILDAGDAPWVSDPLRAVLRDRVAPSGATGVRIDQIELLPLGVPAVPRAPRKGAPPARPAGRRDRRAVPGRLDGRTCEANSLVSAGGVPHRTRPGPRVLDAGLMVVNPTGGSLVLRFGVHKGRPARPVVFQHPIETEDPEQRPADRTRADAASRQGSANTRERPRAAGGTGRGRKRRRGKRGKTLWQRLLGKVTRRLRLTRRKATRASRAMEERVRAAGLAIRRVSPPAPSVLSLADGTAVPATIRRVGRVLYLEIATPSTAPLLVSTGTGPGPAPALEWVRSG
jgi:hypothetical protein